MSNSIWQKLLTALHGKANEVGESVVDQQALRILDQEIRDADNALSEARQALVTIMGKQKVAKDKVTEYDTKISDLEAKAMAALDKGREDLAAEIAETIARLDTERQAEADIAQEFAASSEKMRANIQQSEAQLKSMRQQTDVTRARETVQKAQNNAMQAAGGATGRLDSAAASLERLKERQTQRQAEFESRQQLEESHSGKDLERRLQDAGISPNTQSANAVLERLKASRGQSQSTAPAAEQPAQKPESDAH